MKCLLELDRFPLSWEEKLAYLTFKFLKEDQTACPVDHFFEDGSYIREMRIPKETLFIGRPHVFGHRVDLVSGKILHIESHQKVIREAPFSTHTVPGYQAVFFTMSDIVGRTYHPDDGERDTDVLENRFFEPVEKLKALGADVRRRIKEIEAREITA
jgi:hypothetical protein